MNPLKRIFIVLIVVVVSATLCYIFFNRGVRLYKNHTTQKFDELFLNKTSFDLLFIGSSRTQHSINPKFVDSVLHLNSYNAGISGANMNEFLLVLRAYLVHHPPPKYVVLTIDLHSFDLKSGTPLANYTDYFNYISNPVIADELIKDGYLNKWNKIIPFLRFTDNDDYTRGNFLKGIFNYRKKEISNGEFQYKGYLSNSTIGMVSDTIANRLATFFLSNIGIEKLYDIINICKNNNIKLFFTYAPEYKHCIQNQIKNTPEVFALITTIANKNQIPFLKHDTLAMCSDMKYFSNIRHLTTQGANIYSEILANQIKLYLK